MFPDHASIVLQCGVGQRSDDPPTNVGHQKNFPLGGGLTLKENYSKTFCKILIFVYILVLTSYMYV